MRAVKPANNFPPDNERVYASQNPTISPVLPPHARHFRFPAVRRHFARQSRFLPERPHGARRSRLIAACLLTAVALVGTNAAASEPRPVLRLGILAYLGEESAVSDWRLLETHLGSALPQYAVETTYGDLAALRRAVAEGTVDFLLTNPGQYVELESSFGISRIATLEHGKSPVSSYAVGAAVIARRERDDVHELTDLPGRVLAATAVDAFGGYQTTWRELAILGIDPGRDLTVRFTGFPMQRVLEALDAGQADAAVVRACLIESRPEWQQRYKVLSGRFDAGLGCTVSSRVYPNWPMAALPDTPPAMAREVAIALLQMDAETHGIGWSIPADYQVIHDAFRELHIGPYANMAPTSLGEVLQRYWLTGVAGLVLLLLWVLYTLRTEYLVRSRTAALQAALQERHAVESRMRSQQEQADHLGRLSVLGELSSSLAHELSQPLAGVNNYAQSLLRRLDNGRLTDEAVREASESIVTLSHTAGAILKRMKGFVRKRPSVRETHVLASLVEEAISLFTGMQTQPPAIAVRNQLPGPLRVNADSLQIQQILLNFFKNSQDAMQGLPLPSQIIRVTLQADDGWAWIHVRDIGAGMSDEALQRLFEPFYTTKEDGLGLGLSICKRIAEAHGGQLQGGRAPDGKGMIFSLSLPCSRTQ